MKIYIVRHHYNNGESYEDYREYTDDSLFSTEDKALAFYCSKIIPDYMGEYSIYEKTLDTQEEALIEKSPWVDCAYYRYEYKEEYEEDYSDFEIPDKWEPIDAGESLEEYKSVLEELEAEEEWLTTKREQGEILDEIENDRINDALKESDKM